MSAGDGAAEWWENSRQAFGKLTVSQMLEAADPERRDQRGRPRTSGWSGRKSMRSAAEDDFPVETVQAVREGRDHRLRSFTVLCLGDLRKFR